MLPNLPTFLALRGDWIRKNLFSEDLIIGEDVDIFTRACHNSDCVYSNFMGGYYRWLQPTSLSNRVLYQELEVPDREFLLDHWNDDIYLHDYALRWYMSTIIRNLKNGFKKKAIEQMNEMPPITKARKLSMMLIRLGKYFPYKYLEKAHVVYNFLFWEKRTSNTINKEELDAI